VSREGKRGSHPFIPSGLRGGLTESRPDKQQAGPLIKLRVAAAAQPSTHGGHSSGDITKNLLLWWPGEECPASSTS
jgi:hypothetical protein